MIKANNKRQVIKELLAGKKPLSELKQKKIRFETDEKGIEYMVIPGDGANIYLPYNHREPKEFFLR